MLYSFAPCPSLPTRTPKALRNHTTFCAAQSSRPSPSIPRRTLLQFSVALAAASLAQPPPAVASKAPTSAYEIPVIKGGQPKSLAYLAGKTTLFVNVASYCALTPQYRGLVSLHEEFRPAGFEIIASPCDQFGRQEPGSNEEVCDFVVKQFGARFLLLDKLNVNDAPGGVAPLYAFLKANAPEYTTRVTWNFEKFLIAPDGHVLRRYKPSVLPDEIRDDIAFALKNPSANLPPKKKASLGVE